MPVENPSRDGPLPVTLERGGTSSPDGVPHAYLAAQIGLREAMAGLDVDTVLTSGRRSVVESVTSTAAAAAESVGITVREAVLKDVVLPPEL